MRPAAAAPTRIGLISDTHGLLRAEALAWLRGCERIIHGGDIGGPAILETLSRVAPLTVVRGNNDTGSWADPLRDTEMIAVDGVRILAIHNLAELDVDLSALGVHVVVSGHSHQPGVEERDGVLFVNPGSAGPRRFKLPIALGEVLIEGARARARIVPL